MKGARAAPCDNRLMAFNRVAENRIREAMAEGKFDNLPRAGEPLDLEEYFSAPEDLRMAYAILKNANCAPAEVELLNEIGRLKEALEKTEDEALRQSLREALAHRQTELAVLLERRAKQQPR
jgi:DnaJ-like protein